MVKFFVVLFCFFFRFFKISKAWVCQVWYLSRMGCVTFQLQWNMLFSTHCLYISDQARLERLVCNDITLQLDIPPLIHGKIGLFLRHTGHRRVLPHTYLPITPWIFNEVKGPWVWVKSFIKGGNVFIIMCISIEKRRLPSIPSSMHNIARGLCQWSSLMIRSIGRPGFL